MNIILKFQSKEDAVKNAHFWITGGSHNTEIPDIKKSPDKLENELHKCMSQKVCLEIPEEFHDAYTTNIKIFRQRNHIEKHTKEQKEKLSKKKLVLENVMVFFHKVIKKIVCPNKRISKISKK